MQGFATDRLKICNWAPDIADETRRRALENALEGMLSEPVLRHLPEPLWLPEGDKGISDWITLRAAESDVFLVSEIVSKDLIGLLILASGTEPSVGSTCHLGYLFAETAWGKGYATELVSGLIAAMRGRESVLMVGGVGKDNAASARVLEKAGFLKSPNISGPDTDMFVMQTV